MMYQRRCLCDSRYHAFLCSAEQQRAEAAAAAAAAIAATSARLPMFASSPHFTSSEESLDAPLAIASMRYK